MLIQIGFNATSFNIKNVFFLQSTKGKILFLTITLLKPCYDFFFLNHRV